MYVPFLKNGYIEEQNLKSETIAFAFSDFWGKQSEKQPNLVGV